MSRHYRRDKDGGFIRKYHPHKWTKAWKAAKAARKEARDGFPEQPRDKEGFIPKPGTQGVKLHDPGEIDRFLWTRNQDA